jgi:hypothetical protein
MVCSKEHMPSEDAYTAQLVTIKEEVNQANAKKYEEDHAKWKDEIAKVRLSRMCMPARATKKTAFFRV